MKYERCVVCNAESFGFEFCSNGCKEEYGRLMDEIADNNVCYNHEDEGTKQGHDQDSGKMRNSPRQ